MMTFAINSPSHTFPNREKIGIMALIIKIILLIDLIDSPIHH
jgi:hypothetical protein